MRITREGKTLDARVWAIIGDARAAAGLKPGAARVMQGSFNRGGVARSSGTHDGDGAADLSVYGLTHAQRLRLVNELRKRNCAAWLRAPGAYGWPARLGGPHIHLIVRDQPGLSWGARAQVVAYALRRNGLANKARDPHVRPKALPFVLPGDVVVKQLRYGKTNGSVRALQKVLGIAQDGYFGPATDRAVRAHQRAHRLAVDPVGRSFVGPVQSRMLGLG